MGMSKTSSEQELLEVCIQDLHAARKLAADRLPCVAGEAGAALAPVIEALVAQLESEAARFESMGFDLDGDPNLWMAGIMDDAERDTRSIEPGPLLDTAIIGAVRKAVAADAVSLETALALADAQAMPMVAEQVEAMRARSDATDRALRGLLLEIVGSD
jgi:hypothetical protein